jgi:AcrR family transcriptional regulator
MDESTERRPGLRERKNARTRAAIERAACELSLEQGFDHTTVDQIAERADVSPRTVFTRYATKEAIVFREDDDDSGDLLTRMVLDPAAGGDLVDRLVRFVERSIEQTEDADLELLRLRAMTTDPHLRRLMRGRLDDTERDLAAHLAVELGRPAGDVATRVFAAAVVGLFVAMIDCALARPDGDLLADAAPGVELLRDALAALQAAGR